MELLQIFCFLGLTGIILSMDIHQQSYGRRTSGQYPQLWNRHGEIESGGKDHLTNIAIREGTQDKRYLSSELSNNGLTRDSTIFAHTRRRGSQGNNGILPAISGKSRKSYVSNVNEKVGMSSSDTTQPDSQETPNLYSHFTSKRHRMTSQTGISVLTDHNLQSDAWYLDHALQGRAADQLHNLKNYEITVPMHVDYKGTFLGYVQETTVHRNKRSTSNPTSHTSDQTIPEQSNVYYKIWVFDRYLFLNLTVNPQFLSKSYHVEEWTGSDVIKSQGNQELCYWQGHVISEESTSEVVISDCKGLRGTFTSVGESYFIEPLHNGQSTSDTGQQHIIYQKEAIRNIAQNNTKCGQPEIKSKKHSSPIHNTQQESSFNDIIKPRHRRRRRKYKRERTKSRRGKRSVSVEKYVETLVVVDKMMVDYHGKEEIEPFVLSVMNVVSKLYHDASIGNSINIIVTRLVLLLEDQVDLKLSFHAEDSLQSFCKWQEKINPAENSHDVLHNGIAHHDNAILLTRYDICSHRDEPCGTLGLAPVAGMCESDRSCSIVEDIGLATAFTVAHEMGHNFGMQHDGAGNNCGLPGGEAAKLMASQLTSKTNPFQWSTCSKDYITAFLDSGRGQCLNNPPPDMEFDYLDEMPGQNHSPDTQCKWQYGPKSVMCKPHLMCRELYCINPTGDCITNSIPAAEGTPCSSNGIEDGWCSEGQCLERGFIATAVDGEWSEWSPWAECSRTCGGGVESSERQCDNPRPKHGGRFCIGERKRYRSCNIQDCDSGSKDFREIQCSHYDDILFRGKYYTWKPFGGATHSKPCALNCLAEGYNFYTERAPKVVDGTRCYPDSLDVCVNGECLSVGCDKILGSEAVEDKCRVCDGDDSSCTTTKGFFNKPLKNMTDTYKEILRIPKGAVNIHIRESTVSRNYIAIKTTKDDHYFINGHWTIDWSRKVKVANTVFYYKRPKGEVESVFALGPISEDITALLLLQEDNLGVEYEYNMPLVVEEDLSLEEEDFGWKYLPWSECSATCSTGEMISEVQCVRQSDGRPVDDQFCEFVKPEQQRKSCFIKSCPPTWHTGKWTPCTKSCGSGTKIRKVTCVQTTDTQESEVLDHSQCQGKKPRNRARCNVEWCPPDWTTGNWSQCSPPCGQGTQVRPVSCVTTEGTHVADYKCKKEEKPVERRQCHSEECVKASWVYGDWEECTAQCGQGLQKRDITCKAEDGSDSSQCKHSEKPESVRTCTGPCKPKTEEECIDVPEVTYCPLVVQFQFCNRAYFHHMCCRTCRNAGFHQGYQP